MTATEKFKKVRLFKVSRELNIAVDSLVEHLETAGFAEGLSGKGINASITSEDAYLELLEEFADDKALAARIRQKRDARAEAESGEVPDTPTAEVTESTDEPVSDEAVVEEPVSDEAVADETGAEVGGVEESTEAPDVDEIEETTAVASEVAAPVEPLEAEADPETDVREPAAEIVVGPEEAEVDTEVEVEDAGAVEAGTPASEAEIEAVAEPEEAQVSDAPASVESGVPGIEPDTEPVGATEDVEAQASEADGTPIEPPVGAESEEEIIEAGRYKLQGTKILGKIDLETVPEAEPGSKRKRKRKRKRIPKESEPSKGQVVRKETPSTKKKKKRKGPAVDESDVEQTLQETLRELEAGASRVRQKRRRQKRDERAESRQKEIDERLERESVLRVTEFVSTGELAALMDVAVNELISTLFAAGMMVSINQRLDADTISFVADEMGFEVEFITDLTTTDIVLEEDDPSDLEPRDAVVTVMGHVDHGKTSLLDFIRSENVVAGEAGGITQHIGAYHVQLKNKKALTFLDTPGHEAFTAMRARGAQVTDIVILVVSADDAVMPQTIEAINHARAADVPIVVAINKIDKPDANTQRVMQQLADQNVLVEQWGGKIQCELVSAKTGEGVNELLDRVLLEAEMLDLKANPNRHAVSAVIESRLEKGRGNVATVLVQNGTLRVGDPFVAGMYYGRVRAMFDERDRRVEAVGPAMPAQVIGMEGAPEVGDVFVVMHDEKEAKDVAHKRQQIYREQSMRQRKHITLDEIGRRLALGDFRELHLIVKGDVGGSVEALSDALLKLSTEEVVVNIIHKGVGAINESDVMLASASDAIIVGFQVRPVLGARQLAEREEIDIRLYSVIYHAIEEVHDALEGLLTPEKLEEITGHVEVRETFKVPRIGMIAGCYVLDGKIRRSDKIHLVRDGVVIYDGTLASLKRFKDDVREVQSGYECGMGIENFNDLKVGDQIEAYEIIEKKRTLEYSN